ncbi:hypothetical protein TCAL_13558, partial [Tigriopus californicus]|eukprot:TCALIF_13558-PA protein Name:"Protein of unknown function" AED:0.12 eAED:0.12 QI:74/0/0/1/0/0/2/0/186
MSINDCDLVKNISRAADRALALKVNSKATPTWTVYRRAFDHFQNWYASTKLVTLPANVRTVELYLADIAFNKKSVASVELATAVIGAYHKLHGWATPCDHDTIKTILKGIKRQFSKPAKQRQPMTKTILKAILFHVSARWSDLVNLRTNDFKWSKEGIIIQFTTRKNDQEHVGHEVIITQCVSEFC